MTVYSTALLSLAAARQQMEQVAARVANGANGSAGISQEMVRMLAIRSASKTAVKLVETANEVEKSILNVLA